MQRLGPPGWVLAATLTTFSVKKIIIAKFKEAKPGCNLAKSSMEDYGSERAILGMMIMMMIMILIFRKFSSYQREITLLFNYKDKSANSVQLNHPCLF
jgi:hypothetical protein